MSGKDEQRLFTTRNLLATLANGFGPSCLAPAAGVDPLRCIEGQRLSILRSRWRQQGPRKPGVYGLLDRHGELLYVGKARVLRQRLFSYFRPGSRDKRQARLMKHVCAVVWETASSEFAALHRELELIRRWRPRFNIQHQPQPQRRVYLCLGRPPAPYAYLSSRLPREALAIYGPLPAGHSVKEAVRRLNDWFQLRDCPRAQEMLFAGEGYLFPGPLSPGCLRVEIGTCLGPCAGLCSRNDYGTRVRAARAFLDGQDLTPLVQLQKEIETAAVELNFERAAGLRDQLMPLVWLQEQLEQLRQIKAAGSFIYPLVDAEGAGFWYLIHEGRTLGVLPAPRDQTERQQALTTARTLFRRPAVISEKEPLGYRENLYLIASWFRQHPEEWQKILRP